MSVLKTYSLKTKQLKASGSCTPQIPCFRDPLVLLHLTLLLEHPTYMYPLHKY